MGDEPVNEDRLSGLSVIARTGRTITSDDVAAAEEDMDVKYALASRRHGEPVSDAASGLVVAAVEQDVAVPRWRSSENAARVAAVMAEDRAASTRVQYASGWRQWEKWCADNDEQPLPADPGALAVFLLDRADAGLGVGSLDGYTSAIRYKHLDLRLDDPTVHPAVARVRKGLRRRIGTAPSKQSHPLSVPEVRRIVDYIDRETNAGARDAAMILLGYASAMRRSELAALDLTDVAWKPTGLLLTIRRSKSDQEGKGQLVAVARGQHAETDPVTALHKWVERRGKQDGVLFPRVRRGDHITDEAIGGRAVASILQARAEAAGLGDLDISGHSLRSGHATAAAQAGVDVARIAAQTRHRQVDTLIEHYIRPVEALETTSSKDIGL